MPTLQDLKQNKIIDNPDDLKVMSKDELRKVLPPKEETNTAKEIIDENIGALDALMNKEMKAVKEQEETVINENEEDLDSALFDAPLDDIDNGIIPAEEAEKELQKAFDNVVESVKEDPNIKAGEEAIKNVGEVNPENMNIEDVLKDLDMDDDDFDDEDESDITEDSDDDEDDDELDEEDEKEMVKSIQDQIGEVIRPFNNVVDLKSFTISTKPKSAKKVLESAEEGATATWVLLDSKRPFTCTALGAVEIDNLDPNKTNAQNGRIDALKQMYGTLFRHYVSPNKPGSLEEWVKTISYSDQDNLIFGYYKATFGNSNFMTYVCEKCKEVKIETVPIKDCIKYTDDETKEEVEHILEYGDPTHIGEIKAKLIQISDTLAVSIKNPSIYNVVFEFGVLDSVFTNKYADVLGTISYIEDIYEIDVNERKLVPIVIKEDKKNLTKSVKRRFRAKLEILKTLKPDQYQILLAEIANISRNAERITYCQPEYTCKKCGHKFDETEMSAQELLFTRHQLALIKTLSVE